MALDASIISEEALVHKLRVLFTSDRADVLETSEQLEEAQDHLSRLRESRKRKFTALGVGDAAVLQKLKNSVFLQSRMNALALKQRLRDKLRQRKFEIEKLERSYRRTVNGKFPLRL